MKVAYPKVKGYNFAKITTFDSIQDMITYINNTPMTDQFLNKPYGGPASIRQGKKNWAGTENFEEAMELLKTGWAEKAQELNDKLTQKLNKEATQIMRQKSVYDVVGGNCSVPRYLQGVPTSMIRQVRTPVKQKTITINYNIGFDFTISAKEITNRAVDCLAYVKHLEDSGTRVNLNIIWVSERLSSRVFSWLIPIKKTSERLSIVKTAFCLCHPSILRRIAFACMERDQEIDSSFVIGYGIPVRDPDNLKKIFPNMKFFTSDKS